jgi:hypothetical protein
MLEDYRTVICLRQTASEKKIPIDQLKYEAMIAYMINKGGMKREDAVSSLMKGRKLHEALKSIAQSKGLLISQIVEEAFRDAAGITSPLGYAPAKQQKKGSFFDLNRDAR